MWGDSRSHIDLSAGGGEDPSAVVLPQLLRVRGPAQRRQRSQRGPHVPAGTPALPEVGVHHIKMDFLFDKLEYTRW